MVLTLDLSVLLVFSLSFGMLSVPSRVLIDFLASTPGHRDSAGHERPQSVAEGGQRRCAGGKTDVPGGGGPATSGELR
ncbi:unnamed protein product [Amoebophrya sp. A120]|nr:unnamed protein product [Amoebophrya sp. A120]|eukprot:GSA120T00020835001.1